MRILVVDDSKAVHAYVKSLFHGLNHDLVTATNGKEAVEILTKANFQGIDLVLLDWEMPIMDGASTLLEIRGKSASLPVIMVTSKSDIGDVAKMLENGANEYVMKPYTKDILFEKIGQVVGREVA